MGVSNKMMPNKIQGTLVTIGFLRRRIIVSFSCWVSNRIPLGINIYEENADSNSEGVRGLSGSGRAEAGGETNISGTDIK